MKILLVEDKVLIRMLLKEQFQERGFDSIQETNSGENALLLVREEKQDFIIMDIKLNGKMSGADVMRILSKEQTIPFIFLSAYQDLILLHVLHDQAAAVLFFTFWYHKNAYDTPAAI